MKKAISAQQDVPVIYIGKKAVKKDRTFRTRLEFKPGQTHFIRSDIATDMLKFRDVYTTTGTPEFKQFCETNPVAAAEFGHIELAESEKTALKQAAEKQKEAEQQDEDDDDIEIEVNEAELDDAHLDEIKADINAQANISQLDDWAEEHGLDIELTGKREEREAQLFDAYLKKYQG